MIKVVNDITMADGASIVNLPAPLAAGDVATKEYVDTAVLDAPAADVLPAFFYGSGVDGSVTLTTNTTLTRGYEYQDLTLAAGVQLNTNGYPLLVRGTLTMNDGSAIHRDGNNAIGSSGGTAHTPNVYAGGAGGGTGSSTGGNGLSVTNTRGGAGGKGGDGGLGGTGGTVTAPPTSVGGNFNTTFALSALWGTIKFTSTKMPGGAGGGGGRAISSSNGGGGGAGGGVVVVAAFNIVVNGSARISANGGNGANGASTVSAASGGGGGGGGMVIVISTVEKPTGLTVQAAGGTGGLRHGTNASYTDGAPGAAGYASYRVMN